MANITSETAHHEMSRLLVDEALLVEEQMIFHHTYSHLMKHVSQVWSRPDSTPRALLGLTHVVYFRKLSVNLCGRSVFPQVCWEVSVLFMTFHLMQDLYLCVGSTVQVRCCAVLTTDVIGPLGCQVVPPFTFPFNFLLLWNQHGPNGGEIVSSLQIYVNSTCSASVEPLAS